MSALAGRTGAINLGQGFPDAPGPEPIRRKAAELVVEVLRNTEPTTTSAGAPSKANYKLADGIVGRTKAASAEMLDKHPLYPGLELV